MREFRERIENEKVRGSEGEDVYTHLEKRKGITERRAEFTKSKERMNECVKKWSKGEIGKPEYNRRKIRQERQLNEKR